MLLDCEMLEVLPVVEVHGRFSNGKWHLLSNTELLAVRQFACAVREREGN